MRRNSDCPPLSVLSFILVLLLVAPGASGQGATAGGTSVSLDDAVHQLAERVATIPNLRGPVRVQFSRDTTLGGADSSEWQRLFGKELENLRISFTEDTGANVLRVGLTETPTELVLAAGIRVNEKMEARFVTFPRTVVHRTSSPVIPIRIEKQLIYQTTDRILDAMWSSEADASGLTVLAYHGTEMMVLRADELGKPREVVSLNAGGVRISRDSRGELSADGNQATVMLPGKSCQVSGTEAKCHAAKPLWRAATVLTPACAGGWKLTADGADWSRADLLQAVPDGEGKTGSTALLSDFPGPILSIAAGPSAASALVVTRNLPTGDYEVYKITLACGD